jgi:uncharacterized protein
VTTVNLRTIRLRSGEQFRDVREVELEPLELGGQRYLPAPAKPEAALAISRLSSGHLFELEFETRLYGPCMRCLEEAGTAVVLAVREYQATNPAESDELETPYVVDDRLELSAWARDAVALSLPDQILCKADCAGLCATCGGNLNRVPCECPPPEPDNRWSKLAELRDRL